MAAPLNSNRGMFWRIVRRLLFAHRGRLFVILLALVAGATITAALLNLQVDAKRRLTSEFRAFGPNVIIAPPRSSQSAKEPATLPEAEVMKAVQKGATPSPAAVPFLYLLANVRKANEALTLENPPPAQAVLVGTNLLRLQRIAPAWQVSPIFTMEPEDIDGLSQYCF